MSEDKELTVKVEAIETPRGLVPSISAIESLVGLMNSLLSEILGLFKDIKQELTAIKDSISDVSRNLKSMSVIISNMYEKILELAVNLELVDKSSIASEENMREESLETIKKSLKDLLK